MNTESVRTIFKVDPPKLPRVKQNNFFNKGLNTIRHLKYLIYVESIMGVSRLYLLQCNKFVLWLSYLYIPVLTVSAIFIIQQSEITSPSLLIIRHTVCIEYFILAITATFIKKKKLLNLFEKLSAFDEYLKINKDINVINPIRRTIFWIIGSISYNFTEYLLLKFYITHGTFDNLSFLFFFMISLAHDTEEIFYFTLLRIIFTRIVIVRAHISKVFSLHDDGTNNSVKLNTIEALSNKVNLDIGCLHEVYELLHKCSEQLNIIMSFPMLIMLFTSGLSTTLLLKVIVRVTQIYATMKTSVAITVIIYLLIRCAKYTMLVIIPCYYANITFEQVLTIRTTLHDAVNTMPLDKLKRRNVKAFFMLTKENEFTYALGGVIKLNMTLPLSYISLCTTYLVIIIQFSKFID